MVNFIISILSNIGWIIAVVVVGNRVYPKIETFDFVVYLLLAIVTILQSIVVTLQSFLKWRYGMEKIWNKP